jgi:hypothetical protein
MGSEVFEPVHTPLTPKLPRGGIVQGLEKKFDSDMGSKPSLAGDGVRGV